MLRKNTVYWAKFVKHPQGKYTAMSVGLKDSKTGLYKNYGLFILENIDIQDGDKFKITNIISVDQTEYNGKAQFSVTCEIEVEGQEQTYESSQNDEPSLDITSDDLPF